MSLKWNVERESGLLSSADLTVQPSGGLSPGGSAISLSLEAVPIAETRYTLQPERKSATFSPVGGAFIVERLEASRYHVTLSDEAWIDLVQSGAVVASTDHTSAKGCPGIRKSVDFLIAVGPAAMQISAALASSIKMAVVNLD